MTISNETAAITIPGNGVTTSFAYNFLIPYQADGVTPAVRVFRTLDGVTYTLLRGTDFSISGVGVPTGGAVVYPLSGSALPTGQSLTIERDVDYIQPYAFNNQNFKPTRVNSALDYIVMQIQQLKADFDRFS